jgi:hypothetical protein
VWRRNLSLLLSSCNQWRVSLLHESSRVKSSQVKSSQVESSGVEKRHCGLARVTGLDTAHSVTHSLSQSVSQSESTLARSLVLSSLLCSALLGTARDSTPDTCDPRVTHCHSTTPLLHYTTTPLHHYSTTPTLSYSTARASSLNSPLHHTTPHHTTPHHTTLCAHYTFTPSLHTLTTLHSLHTLHHTAAGGGESKRSDE